MARYVLHLLVNFFCNPRRQSRWFGLSLVWLVALSASTGWAQQCLNFVSVNGRQLEGTPACYFVTYGDDRTPHMQAEVLAQVLGAQVLYDDARARYVFARATDLVEIHSSDNVADALIRRDGVLFVNDNNVKSTMAIRMAGIGYVPIAPIVDAFHGSNSWDAAQRTIHILTSSNAYITTPMAPPFPRQVLAADGEAARNLIPIGGKFVVGTDRAAQQVQQAQQQVQDMHPIAAVAAPTTATAVNTAATIEAEDKIYVNDAQPVSPPPIHIRPESVVPQPLDTQGNVINVPVVPQPMPHPTSPQPAPSQPISSQPVSVQPTAPLPAAPLPTVALPASGVYRLASPRVGMYTSHTRVALDVPASVPYHLAVSGNIMVISLPNSEAYSYIFQDGNPYVQQVRYELLDNVLSLVVVTTYPMAANGGGYNFNFLNDTDGDGQGVLYVDFSPQLRGGHLDILQDYSLDGSAVMPPSSDSIHTDITHIAARQPEATEGQPVMVTPVGLSPTTPTAQPTSEPTPQAPQAPQPPQDIMQPSEQLVSYVAPSEQHRVVVIDPGHGGWDPGAQGYASEEEVVLGIALHLKRLLEKEGIEVILTREDDSSLTEEKRSDLAARAALASGAERNLFISIHANAAHSEKANGIETWVFGKPLNPSLLELAIKENGGGELGQSLTHEAQGIADNAMTGWLKEEQLRLSKQLARAVQGNMVAKTGARNRGVRQNAWYVISRAQIPAILVEVGFVSNPTEGVNLATSTYQQKVAQGIADGIDEFFGAPLAIASN